MLALQEPRAYGVVRRSLASSFDEDDLVIRYLKHGRRPEDMMHYLSRIVIGLEPPRSVLRMHHSMGLFVHWSAGRTAASSQEGIRRVRATQRYHMGKGWADIGYSWLVDDAGTIYEGRGWGVEGAHTRAWNTRSHACCWLGGPGHDPTSAAMGAIQCVLEEHDRRYGRGFLAAHGEVSQTQCPGPDLAAWVAEQGRPL
jgi:hypothetical protein